ncbi:hypothetical protein EZV61_09590 [Corallincola luteus]|uniref:Peptidase M60 domain-containing protein n=1 Tax=Corallincola luteus TaxID=1775177 RepID=A0ABY2AM18_9GAMM|nr:ImpA family metalloprotease [Corallincola luteus]TCI03776.1 hypothetical protein EZV61_09590 [Corallincola luteus]
MFLTCTFRSFVLIVVLGLIGCGQSDGNDSSPEDNPDVVIPPSGNPDVETPPEDNPDVETPPEDNPDVETPPEDNPDVETPPEDNPDVETPPEDNPDVETPPEDNPDVETPPEQPYEPMSPSELSINAASINTISLSWTDEQNSEYLSVYELFRDGELIKTLAVDVFTYTDTELEPNTSYQYSIRAVGSQGEYSNQISLSASTLSLPYQPSAPTELAIIATSSNTISLRWSDTQNSDLLSSYELFRDEVLIKTLAVEVLSYIDTELTPNTTYVYSIRTVSNESEYSEKISTTAATTQAENELRLQAALASGDSAGLESLDSQLIIEQLLAQLQERKAEYQPHLKAIYGDEAISYAPGNNTHFVHPANVDTFIPLLVGNKGATLAAASIDKEQRVAAFGSIPIYAFNRGEQDYQPHFKRLLNWLLEQELDESSQALKVSIALHTGGTSRAIGGWFNSHYPDWEVSLCTSETDGLEACFTDSDLVVLGSQVNSELYGQSDIVTALTQVKTRGTPLLYLHQGGKWATGLTAPVLSFFGFTTPPGQGNNNLNDAAQWSKYSDMPSGFSAPLEVMLNHLDKEDFYFDWSVCGSNNCDLVEGLQSELMSGLENVRGMFASLEGQAVAMFNTEVNSINKLLVLLGDLYRRDIAYPIDRLEVDGTLFAKAQFADYSVYYNRHFTPAQTDLGDFSVAIAADHPTVNRNISITPKNMTGDFTAVGLYALPGRAVTISRTDNNSNGALIYFNTMRASSTRVFNIDRNAYSRPKWMRSHKVALNAGQSITLTSPYGGTIMLDPSGSEQIDLAITGAAEHAFVDDMDKMADYAQALETTDLPWTQIKTPFVEIHSRTDYMRQSANNAIYQGDMTRYVEDIWTYVVKGAYEFAGIVGEGLNQDQAISDFCASYDWDCSNETIHRIPRIQHINSDNHTACGSACSGNPIDIGFALEPQEWGVNHELGHNLQPARLRIHGGKSGEVSNNIFPLRARMRYGQTYGIAATGHTWDQGYKLAFNMIQDALKNGDTNQLWLSGNNLFHERLAFYIQLMHMGDQLDYLDDGWQLITLIYLHDRLFGHSTDWDTDKDKLGFSTYTEKPSNIDGNDFMLLSLSWITKKDYRTYFDVWGISYSPEAGAQVAAYGFAESDMLFYLPENQSYMEPVQYILPLDGITAWLLQEPGQASLELGEKTKFAVGENANIPWTRTGEIAAAEWKLLENGIEVQSGVIAYTSEQSGNISLPLNQKGIFTYQLSLCNATYCTSSEPFSLTVGTVDTVKISLDESEKCLALNSDTVADSGLYAPECSDADNQEWLWDDAGYIRSVKDLAYCIDGGKMDSGGSLFFSLCGLSDAQKWLLEDDKTIALITPKNGKNSVWDQYSSDSVHLYSHHAQSNQRWKTVVVPNLFSAEFSNTTLVEQKLAELSPKFVAPLDITISDITPIELLSVITLTDVFVEEGDIVNQTPTPVNTIYARTGEGVLLLQLNPELPPYSRADYDTELALIEIVNFTPLGKAPFDFYSRSRDKDCSIGVSCYANPTPAERRVYEVLLSNERNVTNMPSFFPNIQSLFNDSCENFSGCLNYDGEMSYAQYILMMKQVQWEYQRGVFTDYANGKGAIGTGDRPLSLLRSAVWDITHWFSITQEILATAPFEHWSYQSISAASSFNLGLGFHSGLNSFHQYGVNDIVADHIMTLPFEEQTSVTAMKQPNLSFTQELIGSGHLRFTFNSIDEQYSSLILRMSTANSVSGEVTWSNKNTLDVIFNSDITAALQISFFNAYSEQMASVMLDIEDVVID